MRKYIVRSLRNLRATLHEARTLLLPPDKAEAILCTALFLAYAWLGAQVLYHTPFIDMEEGTIGSYLGYDNISYLHTRGGTFDICHPFFNVFHILKTFFLLPFSAMGHARTGILGLLLGTSLLTSSAVTLVFRYLRRIVGLPTRRALLLSLCCAAFFTTTVLSFTIETYTFSLPALMFSLYFLAEEWKKCGYVRGRSVFLLTFLCGGITVTNAAKPLLLLLLNRRMTTWHRIFRSMWRCTWPFAACVCLVFALYSIKIKLLAPDEPSPVETTIQLKKYFIFGDSGFAQRAFTDFWGSTMLTAPLTPQTVGTETVLRPASTYGDAHWKTVCVGIILLFCTVSAWKARRNKYVQQLLLFLSIDGLAHFVLRYGMNEAVIFGGHWLFSIPLLLGWGYGQIPPKLRPAADALLLALLCALLIGNGAELLRVYSLAC